MYKVVTGLLFLAASVGVLADNLSDSNKLFDFAENAFPQYFSPAGIQTQSVNGYLLRHYPATNTHGDVYIGTQGNSVYAFTAATGLVSLGLISDFVEIEYGFTSEYLNGKTLYEVFDDKETESSPSVWVTVEMTFSDSTVYMAEVNASGAPTGQAVTVPYSITAEGYLTYEDDGLTYMRIMGEKANYFEITWQDNITDARDSQGDGEWLFFDLQAIQDFISGATGSGVSSFTSAALAINGHPTIEKWGESPTVLSNNGKTKIFVRNDHDMLYALIDDTANRTASNPECESYEDGGWGCSFADRFEVVFDNDANGSITSDYDYKYDLCFDLIPPAVLGGTGTYQITDSPALGRAPVTRNSGCSNFEDGMASTGASVVRGFGPTYNESQSHRYYEIAIPQKEFCIAADRSITALFQAQVLDDSAGHAGEIANAQKIILENASPWECNAANKLEVVFDQTFPCNHEVGGFVAGHPVYIRNNHNTLPIHAEIKVFGNRADTHEHIIEKTFPANTDTMVAGCSTSGDSPEDYTVWTYEVIKANF